MLRSSVFVFECFVLETTGFIDITPLQGNAINLLSQNDGVLRILIYTSLKVNKKEIFVQVSSPLACFISKIQQFNHFKY